MAATQQVFELDGVEVKLSSPDKVYFPECGVTKGNSRASTSTAPTRS